MARLLIGQSYFLRFDVKLWHAQQAYPPLGSLYAAAYLRRAGHQVALFDAMLAQGEDDWGQALDQQQPDVAILFEDNFNYLSKMSLLRMRQAAFAMIGMAKQRALPVIVAGADMSDHADAYLQAGADYVLMGEGEASLGELLALLANGTPSEVQQYAVQGIAYRHKTPDGEARTVKTPARPVFKDLDDLPMPAWDLVDMSRYRALWKQAHGYFSLNMVTTRGCPFHCNWCAKPIWGQKYAMRSPLNVVQEMAHLKQHYAPEHIWFMDDIMGIRDLWIEEFADLLDEHQAHIPFKSLNRADLLLRGRTIPALARAKADIVWMGAESGSQKILDAMDKGTQVEQIYEAARKLREHGIKVAFFLQFGYPGETREDIAKTLQMVRDLLPDDIGISVSYPLPGTPFYERVRHELGDKANWYDSQDLAMLYQGPFRTEFYRQLHTVVHKDYRSRKTWAQWRGKLAQPANWRTDALRQLAAMLYHRASLPLAQRKLEQLARLPHTPTPLANVVVQ